MNIKILICYSLAFSIFLHLQYPLYNNNTNANVMSSEQREDWLNWTSAALPNQKKITHFFGITTGEKGRTNGHGQTQERGLLTWKANLVHLLKICQKTSIHIPASPLILHQGVLKNVPDQGWNQMVTAFCTHTDTHRQFRLVILLRQFFGQKIEDGEPGWKKQTH